MESSALHKVIAYIRRCHRFRPAATVLLSVAVGMVLCTPADAVNSVGIRIGHQRFTKNVRSLAEIRWNNLTRQGWDISCGAAALSTLLTYHHQREFSELAITLTILKNSDPALVRQRGGFSLYDLKRFVGAIGLEGVGYGKMNVNDLHLFALPAIIPVRIRGLDHFVIFRKIIGRHVLLGDPAFGNISMPLAKFNAIWKSRIAFYVVTREEKEHLGQQDGIRKHSPLSPTLMESSIPSFQHGSRMLNRIPMIPVTRRPMAVTP